MYDMIFVMIFELPKWPQEFELFNLVYKFKKNMGRAVFSDQF